MATIETKFRQADEELLQLRSNLKHYEGLVDEYKSQVGTGNRKLSRVLWEWSFMGNQSLSLSWFAW